MQCFCFYMHHCGHCVRHLEGSCEFIGEWKQKRNYFFSNFHSRFTFGVWIESVVNPSARFLSLQSKKKTKKENNIVFWIFHSIECNCNTANTLEAWRVFQSRFTPRKNEIQTSNVKVPNEPNVRTNGINGRIAHSFEQLKLSSQEPQQNNWRTTRANVNEQAHKKNCVYRTNITSYQTLDQWFYWAIFKRFIRMKQHRLFASCLCE